VARTSQTRLAVLGALSVEPMTGYAIRQGIADSIGHFWSESFGQIYPTLAALETEGLVRRAGSGRTSGSTFELTDAGRRHLRDLLAEPIESVPARNGLLLRLFFGRHLAPDVRRDLLRGALADAERALEQYGALRAEVSAQTHADAPFWLMTVSAGEHTAAAQAAWARECLAALGPDAEGG
jgi:DNA-binding PadR family transcriptional regulator